MLKTNAKQVTEAVRQYLAEAIIDDLQTNYDIETDKPFTEYKRIMELEKGYLVKRSAPFFVIYKDWLQGLAGYGADIYYHSSRRGFPGGYVQDLLQDWLQETDAEVLQFDASTSEELAAKLTFRVFCKEVEREAKR